MGGRLSCCVALLGGCLLMEGCAAVAPFSSLISSPLGGSPPLQVHEQTAVTLDRDNFVLVKTNAYGRSRGFSLLGVITIFPARLTTAVKRMYADAEMPAGRPQTVAHLIIEHSSSYYILFGIPRVEVLGDIVEYRPARTAAESAERKRPPPKPPPEEIRRP